jgi:hypothetical protein
VIRIQVTGTITFQKAEGSDDDWTPMLNIVAKVLQATDTELGSLAYASHNGQSFEVEGRTVTISKFDPVKKDKPFAINLVQEDIDDDDIRLWGDRWINKTHMEIVVKQSMMAVDDA